MLKLMENLNFDPKTQVETRERVHFPPQMHNFEGVKFCAYAYNIECGGVGIMRARRARKLRSMLDESTFRPGPERDPTPGRQDPAQHGPESPEW